MAQLRAKLSVYSDRQLLGMLNGWAFACLEDLREAQEKGHAYPPLYKAGVRYMLEPNGKEEWQLPADALRTKRADCEDLACWRVAELWLQGEPGARVFLKRVNPRLRHIQVLRADGTIEDPSRALGMR